MNIRVAASRDREDIRQLYLSAFPEEERELVAELALQLLEEETHPPVLSLIAQDDGVLSGHVAFSPVAAVDQESFQGYILAPLAVHPDAQKRGIGTMLINHGIQQVKEMKADVLLVYGDPAYYGRFGFGPEVAERCIPPYELQYPFGWQGLAIHERFHDEPPVNITCAGPLSNPVLW